jgi:aryl-alcohol dehydrogenase-like predicted oxidoreductase
MDAHFRSFEKKVLPELVKDGIGVLGMKPLASGLILPTRTATPIECLHYALNLPTSTVITGINKMEYLEQALEAVRTFKPMGEAQIASLLARTRTAALTGKHELFKTATRFDATALHPDWIA